MDGECALAPVLSIAISLSEPKLKKDQRGLPHQVQRVDMTNAQAAYDYVLQVWV